MATETQNRPNAAAAAPSAAAEALTRLWSAALQAGGDAGLEAAFFRPMIDSLRDAPVADIVAFLSAVVGHQRRLIAEIAKARGAVNGLAERIESLTSEPKPIARLIRVDAEERTATVATLPGSVFEVSLDSDLDASVLVSGNDVVLTSARSAVLADYGSPGSVCGGTRLFTFQRWWGTATEAGRPALATAENGSSVVIVPPPLVDPVNALAADAARRVQLLVDRFDQVVAVDSGDGVDPMTLAKAFLIRLAPVPSSGVAGLAQNRRQIEHAVDRVVTAGAFVIAQGPPGTGKSLMAGHARHLLEARGHEVVVLGLDPNREQMWYRQEEAQVVDLCSAAQALARLGRIVVILLDEVDRLFHSSRTYGQSVHDNALRATLLEQIGTRMDLRGILIFGTTNKAATLPSELLSRAPFLLTFDAVGAADARAILDVHVSRECSSGTARDEVLDAVVDFIYDGSDGAVVAEGVRRDRSRMPIRRRDLKQVSGRLFKDLAARFEQSCAEMSNGTRAHLTVDEALRLCRQKFDEVVAGIEITPENVGERTFLPTTPHNPFVEVTLRPRAINSAPQSWFRYRPVEIDDDQI